MKKCFFTLASSFFLALVILSSCQKDVDTPDTKTKTELLSQGTWKYKSATVSGSAYSIPACQQDNIYTFLATKMGSMDEGATKCNINDPSPVPFTWSFESGETSILFSVPLFGANSVTLVSISQTELVLSYPYTPPFGPTLLIVVTFTH
ncbi:MAG: hypothetical protein ABIP79_17940 [Chitinophagaceae bacterium]